MSQPVPTPVPRLSLVDTENTYVDEPSLLICKIAYLKRRMWAIYTVHPHSYELVTHRVIHKDAPANTTAATLIELLELGVESLPGSKVIAMDHGTASDILEATSLRVDVMAHSFRIRNNLEHVRSTLLTPEPHVTPQTPKTAANGSLPIVIATDASRRSGGQSAYGWITLYPGTQRKPDVQAYNSKASRISNLETSAIIRGLLSVRINSRKPIHVMSDSQPALRIFNTLMLDTAFDSDLWKIYPHANARSIHRYAERVNTYWIRGHSGNPANEAVDALVRGATLASTHDGVDFLAMQGLEQIIQERTKALATLNFKALLAGAEPFHEHYRLRDAA